MASIQIQRPATKTKNAIDQKQSLEVVQTLLHGGLSSLSYQRALFSDKVFDEQFYVTGDHVHSYADYAAAKLPKTSPRDGTTATKMQVLRRGRSRRVDQFLDWLEKGAFVALKAGKLKALQLYVHADEESRQKVVETYTFTIQYSKNAGDGQPVASVEFESPGSEINERTTNLSLQFLLRQIDATCSRLPNLPEKRFLSMELFYLPGMSKDYKPDGFRVSENDTVVYATAKGWQRHVEKLHDLRSSFHRSELKIVSLTSSATRDNIEVPFPRALRYDHASSTHQYITSTNDSQEAQVLDDTRDASETVTLSPPTSVPARNLQEAVMTPLRAQHKPQSDIFIEGAVTHQLIPRNHKRPLCNLAASSNASQPRSSSALSRMKHEFEGMMRSETMSQGDTQSQYLGPPQTLNTKSTCSPSKLNATLPRVATCQLCLISSKASEIARDAQNLRRHARELAKSEGKTTKKGHILMCQCGLKEEEGDMVQCETCHTWQHLPCYGFTGLDDPRLYDRHTCYHCLLAGDKTDTLEALQRLVQKRRVMHFIIQHGTRSQTEFIDDINMPVEVAGPIYQMLKSAGYFVPATGSHKAGYKKTGKPLFVAVRDGPNYEKMLTTLFDPLTLIAHYYQVHPETPVDQMALKQHLFAAQSSDMPPPATPASKLRKQKAMTPASGLDQRASVTPFQTPVRRLTKRSFEEDATPASKRLKSVQSQVVLNANGLSSSPAGLMR
ncbi:hypothetical protein KC343_g4042 [Hortaea werneckii]|nr:hypothetical protein KC317_g5722 [Hortaea werneckii]KAI7616412.1 hypothetical protein KC346_g6002 [Hortaea werneckii]KAI7631418.1 hypothetical protein KC343_g4042 [Hortaea werneckii]KAI7661493.1 hypothetical protein KC319_g8396 [Hortaea werneckii]KAI7710135.1 hypothetical protein KC322_g4479 [Hortaea werneckii]